MEFPGEGVLGGLCTTRGFFDAGGTLLGGSSTAGAGGVGGSAAAALLAFVPPLGRAEEERGPAPVFVKEGAEAAVVMGSVASRMTGTGSRSLGFCVDGTEFAG